MKHDIVEVADKFLTYVKPCVGKEKAMLRESVLIHLQMFYFKTLTDSEMRLAKEFLIEQGEPICSGPGGYWYAKDQTEALEAAKYLEGKAKDMLHKAKLLKDSAHRIYGGQLELV